ncbi:MAG: hypothetical protein ACHQ50_12000, partial [Fimbriimonadales bacterium]
PYTRSDITYRSPLVERRDPTQFGYAYNADLSGALSASLDRGTTVTFFDSTILTRSASSTLATLPSPPRYGFQNTIIYADGHFALGRYATVSELYAQSRTRMMNLSTSLLTYANDYDERLPPVNQWMDATYPYTSDSESYRSPLVERGNHSAYGYAFSSELAGQAWVSIPNPASTVSIFDSTVLTRNATAPISTMPTPARYAGKNTVGYLDGHVP